MRTCRASMCVMLGAMMLVTAMPVATAGVHPEWRRAPGGMPMAVTVDARGNIYVTGQIWAPPADGDQYHRWAMLVREVWTRGRARVASNLAGP